MRRCTHARTHTHARRHTQIKTQPRKHKHTHALVHMPTLVSGQTGHTSHTLWPSGIRDVNTSLSRYGRQVLIPGNTYIHTQTRLNYTHAHTHAQTHTHTGITETQSCVCVCVCVCEMENLQTWPSNERISYFFASIFPRILLVDGAKRPARYKEWLYLSYRRGFTLRWWRRRCPIETDRQIYVVLSPVL